MVVGLVSGAQKLWVVDVAVVFVGTGSGSRSANRLVGLEAQGTFPPKLETTYRETVNKLNKQHIKSRRNKKLRQTLIHLEDVDIFSSVCSKDIRL